MRNDKSHDKMAEAEVAFATPTMLSVVPTMMREALAQKSLDELANWQATHGAQSEPLYQIALAEFARRQTAAQENQARWVKIAAIIAMLTLLVSEFANLVPLINRWLF